MKVTIDVPDDIYEFYKLNNDNSVTISLALLVLDRMIKQIEENKRMTREEPQERSNKCSKCEYHINPDYTRCKECGAERSDKE